MQLLNRRALALAALDGDAAAPLILADLLEEEGDVRIAAFLRGRVLETDDAVGVALCVFRLRAGVRLVCCLLMDHLARRGGGDDLLGVSRCLDHIWQWTGVLGKNDLPAEDFQLLEKLAESDRTCRTTPAYRVQFLPHVSRQAIASFADAVAILRCLDEFSTFGTTCTREPTEGLVALATAAQHLHSNATLAEPMGQRPARELNDEVNWRRGRVRRELLSLWTDEYVL